MIENIRCKCCRYRYEVVWEDGVEDDYVYDEDDVAYDSSDVSENELYPEYCPFCGSHISYEEE